MKTDELRSLQAPIKDGYRQRPETALVTLRAEGRIGEGLTCKVETAKAFVEAGLHPATGGDGLSACSGDMLLEALVACAQWLSLSVSNYGTQLFALRAISTFAALWPCPKMLPLGSGRFDCTSIWALTPVKSSSPRYSV